LIGKKRGEHDQEDAKRLAAKAQHPNESTSKIDEQNSCLASSARSFAIRDPTGEGSLPHELKFARLMLHAKCTMPRPVEKLGSGINEAQRNHEMETAIPA
jgi:hypothetical protein